MKNQIPQYEAEGGEIVDGGIPTAFNGGSISPNSSTSAKINGQSHAQGGVDMSGGERVFSDKLKASSDISKELGYTGVTYAKIADKITKKIGKLEEASKSNDRFAKETANRTLPELQSKLDKLFMHQETFKQAAIQKDFQKLQMKYGGNLPKLGLGGDIAAGLVGVAGGALGSIPIVGDMAQKGLYAIHDSVDNNMTDQEKSIRGFGQAAGAIGTGVVTGNVGGAVKGAADGIATGINESTDYRNADIVNPLASVAGMAGGLINGKPENSNAANSGVKTFRYGGMLPKYVLGGTPPPTFEEWITRYPGLANDSKEAQMQSYNDFIAARGENYNYALDGTGGSIPTDENGNPVNYPDINGTTMETQYGQSVPSYRPSAIVNSPMRQDFMANGTPNGDGTYSKFETTYPPTTESDVPKSTAEQVAPPPPGTNPMTWQDALYKGAAYAPTIYNAVRGMQKPQVLNAEDFQNPYEQNALGLMNNRRYNIDPVLQSNRSSFNNLRENIKSGSGGNSGSYLSNLQMSQLNKDKADAGAWATKNNFDNQYKAEEASMLGQMGSQRAQTKFSIQDVNDRNRAARNAFMGAAATGVSNITQNERHMRNLEANDAIRAKTLEYMNPDWGYTIDPTTGRPTGELKYKTTTK